MKPYITVTDEAIAEGEPIAYVHPANQASVDKVLNAPEEGYDGRSPWVWVRLVNGDLILGVYPHGDTYIEVTDDDAAYPDPAPEPIYGLMADYRDYKCAGCGKITAISTNHTGAVSQRCPECSWRTAPNLEFPASTPNNRRHTYVGGPPIWPTDYNWYAMSERNKAAYIEWSNKQAILKGKLCP